MKQGSRKLALSIIALSTTSPVFAAQVINLDQSPPINPGQFELKQINISTDFRHTVHTRVQQTYAGYKVFGADAVIHTTPYSPHAGQISAKAGHGVSMDGTLYQNLQVDLGPPASPATAATQNERVVQHVMHLYHAENGTQATISHTSAEKIVYVDDQNKAHWAYQVSFKAKSTKSLAIPTYVIDAATLQVYLQWDDLHTLETAEAGGLGGNEKTHEFVYDGAENNMPKLAIARDTDKGICYLQNKVTTVRDMRKSSQIVSFPCKETDSEHGDLYWDGSFDKINGAFSPSNDALYAGNVINGMYMSWYKVPPLVDFAGKQLMLTMVVHENMENAYWDTMEEKMYFGDGGDMFYPLVSLDVGAHEISHGFTSQHSNLIYSRQSGGLNESFSDMAAMAAEYYASGTNTWQIGPTVMKGDDVALRYMDQPSKDCDGGKPGQNCSIDDASQYFNGLNVHYSSGVYNHVFYLLANSPGWNTRKAFDVMVQANSHYWTSNATFQTAACGVMKAARDYEYDLDTVAEVMKEVSIDTEKCKL